MWYSYGRKVSVEAARKWDFVIPTSVFLFLCTAEVTLGALAFHRYITNNAFDASQMVGFWLLVIVAGAISTPLLIFEATTKFGKGKDSVQKDEREASALEAQRQKEAARIEALNQLAMNRYEQEIRQYESRVQREVTSHAKALEKQREDLNEFEQYRNEPDYQALLKAIGRINVIRTEISRLESRINSIKISRGHEKNGKSASN